MEPATYTISEQDQLAFNILHWRGTVPKALLYVGIAVAAMLILAAVVDGIDVVMPVLIGGTVGAAIMLLLARYVMVPRHARRAYRDFALIKEPIELSLREDGFALHQPSAHVDAKWEKMIAWDENAQVFAIYVTRQQAYILPKGQVASEVVDFARQRLMASGLRQKGKTRK